MSESSSDDDDVPTWGAKEGTMASAKMNNDATKSVKKYNSKIKEAEAHLHGGAEKSSHEKKLKHEVEALAEDNSALQAALTEALNQISSLEAQLEQGSSSKELTDALDKISTLEGKLVKKELMEDTMLMDTKASQAALEDALKKVAELEKKLSRSESAATMDSGAAKTALKDAQSKIFELEESLSKAVYLADSTRTQKDRVAQERDALKKEVAALSKNKAGLDSEMAILQQQIVALKDQAAAATAVSQSLVMAQQQLQKAAGSKKKSAKSQPAATAAARSGSRLGAPSREPREREDSERKPAVPKFSRHKPDLIHIGKNEKHRKPGKHGPHYLTTTNEVELRNKGYTRIPPHMRDRTDHTSAPAHSLHGAPEATHDLAFMRHLDHDGDGDGEGEEKESAVEPPKKGAQAKRKPMSWAYKGSTASARRYNDVMRAVTKGQVAASTKKSLPYLGSPSRRVMRPSPSAQPAAAPRYRSRSVPDTTRGREPAVAKRRTQAPKPTRPRRRREEIDQMLLNSHNTAAMNDSSDGGGEGAGKGGEEDGSDDDDGSPLWGMTTKKRNFKKEHNGHIPLPPSAETSALDDSQLSASSVLSGHRMNKSALLHAGVPLNSSQENISLIVHKKANKRAMSMSRSPPRHGQMSHATMGTPSRRVAKYRSYSASPQRAINGRLTYRPPFQRPFISKPACTFGSGR